MKATIKAAREAINQKDYAEALALCNAGLDDEPDNYFLLVFKALAQSNSDSTKDAIATYKKAIKANPQALLAWQGLLSIIESNSSTYGLAEHVEPINELRKIYLQSKDMAKHYEMTRKLASLYQKNNDITKAADLLHWLRSQEARELYAGTDLLPDQKALLMDTEQLWIHWESATITREVEAQRYRLNSDPLPVLKAKVEAKVILESKLEKVYFDLLDVVSESDQQAVAKQLLERLQQKIPLMTAADAATEQLAYSIKFKELISRFTATVAIAAELALDQADVLLLKEYSMQSLQQYQAGDYTGTPSIKRYAFVAHICAQAIEAGEQFVPNPSDIDLIKTVVQSTKSLFVTFVHANMLLAMGENSSALAAIESCQKLVEAKAACRISFNRMPVGLCRMQGIALAGLGRYEEARLVLLNASESPLIPSLHNDTALVKSLIKTFAQLKEHALAIELLQQTVASASCTIDDIVDLARQLFYSKKYTDSIASLLQALQLDTAHADALYLMGRVHWDMDKANRTDPNSCLHYFLSAVKADASHAGAFLYLGHYYWRVKREAAGNDAGNRLRARKCYIKAFELDARSIDAAIGAGEIMLADGEWAPAMELLEPLTSDNLRCSAIWIIIGLAASKSNLGQKAITAFQNALKGEHPDELRCLTLLADAYYNFGKYMASLKAYTRALELDPAEISANFGLAAVKVRMGQYDEALQLYNGIRKMPSYASNFAVMAGVLYGEAQGCLAHANAGLKEGIFGQALRSVTKGTLALKEYFETAPTLLDARSALAWHLLGNCLLKLDLLKDLQCDNLDESLTAWIASLQMPAGLESVQTVLCAASKQPSSLFVRSAAVAFAHELCLCSSARSNASSISECWTNIGLAAYRHYTHHANMDSLRLAGECAKEALKALPCSVAAWNLLGVVHVCSGNQIMQAQHCFIKSITHEKDDTSTLPVSSSWCNLALLYVINGDYDLAKGAFERAQLQDVDCSVAWLGTCLIGERIGGSSPEQLFSALQHAVEYAEGTLIPAHWLYASKLYERAISLARVELKTEDDTAALWETLANARVALLRILALRPNFGAARVLLGLVHELEGSAGLAFNQFERAIMLAEVNENIGQAQKAALVQDLQRNLARVAVDANRLDQAMLLYKQLLAQEETRGAPKPTLDALLLNLEAGVAWARRSAAKNSPDDSAMAAALGHFQVVLNNADSGTPALLQLRARIEQAKVQCAAGQLDRALASLDNLLSKPSTLALGGKITLALAIGDLLLLKRPSGQHQQAHQAIGQNALATLMLARMDYEPQGALLKVISTRAALAISLSKGEQPAAAVIDGLYQFQEFCRIFGENPHGWIVFAQYFCDHAEVLLAAFEGVGMLVKRLVESAIDRFKSAPNFIEPSALAHLYAILSLLLSKLQLDEAVCMTQCNAADDQQHAVIKMRACLDQTARFILAR